jgi:hypothetical protein
MVAGELMPGRSSWRADFSIQELVPGGRKRCVEGEKPREARLNPLQACRCVFMYHWRSVVSRRHEEALCLASQAPKDVEKHACGAKQGHKEQVYQQHYRSNRRTGERTRSMPRQQIPILRFKHARRDRALF